MSILLATESQGVGRYTQDIVEYIKGRCSQAVQETAPKEISCISTSWCPTAEDILPFFFKAEAYRSEDV